MFLLYSSTNIYLILQKTGSDHDGDPDPVAVLKYRFQRSI